MLNYNSCQLQLVYTENVQQSQYLSILNREKLAELQFKLSETVWIYNIISP